jgi:hypothetical protein
MTSISVTTNALRQPRITSSGARSSWSASGCSSHLRAAGLVERSGDAHRLALAITQFEVIGFLMEHEGAQDSFLEIHRIEGAEGTG